LLFSAGHFSIPPLSEISLGTRLAFQLCIFSSLRGIRDSQGCCDHYRLKRNERGEEKHSYTVFMLQTEMSLFAVDSPAFISA
jgi:hypothetical protein